MLHEAVSRSHTDWKHRPEKCSFQISPQTAERDVVVRPEPVQTPSTSENILPLSSWRHSRHGHAGTPRRGPEGGSPLWNMSWLPRGTSSKRPAARRGVGIGCSMNCFPHLVEEPESGGGTHGHCYYSGTDITLIKRLLASLEVLLCFIICPFSHVLHV